MLIFYTLKFCLFQNRSVIWYFLITCVHLHPPPRAPPSGVTPSLSQLCPAWLLHRPCAPHTILGISIPDQFHHESSRGRGKEEGGKGGWGGGHPLPHPTFSNLTSPRSPGQERSVTQGRDASASCVPPPKSKNEDPICVQIGLISEWSHMTEDDDVPMPPACPTPGCCWRLELCILPYYILLLASSGSSSRGCPWAALRFR